MFLPGSIDGTCPFIIFSPYKVVIINQKNPQRFRSVKVELMSSPISIWSNKYWKSFLDFQKKLFAWIDNLRTVSKI